MNLLLSHSSRRVSRQWAGIGSFSAIPQPFGVLVYPDGRVGVIHRRSLGAFSQEVLQSSAPATFLLKRFAGASDLLADQPQRF
jgi:hypothetical protein